MGETDLLGRIEALEIELARLKTLVIERSLSTSDAATPRPREQASSERPASRRELLRLGAVALGAAATATEMAPAVDAADGDPVIIGAENTGSGITTLTTTTDSCLVVRAPSGVHGLIAYSLGLGVYGRTDSTINSEAGVYGTSFSATGEAAGVFGRAASPSAASVHGVHSAGGNAVRAEVPPGATKNAIALYALNYSSYAGAGPGAGGFAIYGLSAKGHGLVGATAATGAAAVVGASNGVPGAYAGAFYGAVFVSGDFTVAGGAKSAAVPHPDGSHRRLYCVESPESWFEDFGRATLVCGEAVVPLDRDFAAVADVTAYHVFLTGHDGRFDLSVSDQTADGFRVKAASGVADGTFSWRVVAKRKDIPGPRFEPVVIPSAPRLPPVPAPSTETAPPPILAQLDRRRSNR